MTFFPVKGSVSLAAVLGPVVIVSSLSHVRLFVTLWTVAHQASLCMGFSRQECWSGLLFPSPGNLPEPATEPVSPASAGEVFTAEPWEAP